MSKVVFNRPQHKKRFDRAEKCCAAFREYLCVHACDRYGQKTALDVAINALHSWMRVAPKKVKYRRKEQQ